MTQKRLHKSREDKKLCGVCGGVAEYLSIDPVIVRVIWAVLGLFWFTGVILYIVCAFVMPFEDELSHPSSSHQNPTDNPSGDSSL